MEDFYKKRDFRRRIAKARFTGKNTVCESLRLTHSNAKSDDISGQQNQEVLFDAIALSDNNRLHFAKLEMIDSPDLWNGNFFGQMLVNDMLFRGTSLSELTQSFASHAARHPDLILGDITRITSHLEALDERKDSSNDKNRASFSSLTLIVCGGEGFELSRQHDPIPWVLFVGFKAFLAAQAVDFDICHAFINGDNFAIIPMENINPEVA